MHNNQLDLDTPSTVEPTRRTIMAGAAWTIPVIAVTVAAPLAAASPCGEASIDWGTDFTRTDRLSGSGSTPTGSGRLVNFSLRAFDGVQNSVGQGNFTTYSGGAGLNLLANNDGTGLPDPTVPSTPHATTYRVQFAEPVTDVEFTIWDIDGAGTSTENVRVPTAGAALTVGSNLIARGGGWYGSRTPYVNTPTSDLANAIVVRFAGPITSFDINMSRPSTQGGQGQTGAGLGLSGITFQAPC